MSTPRIRSDLQVTPAEEGGIKYFDVSDPKSGARMRLYDFEWLIAERMDGRRAFDDVALWARERLGIAPTASDLEEYARRLRDLGFFELGEVEEAPVRSAPTAATMMAEAPKLPSSGNGAGKAPFVEDTHDEMPLVAEAPLMGGMTPAAEAIEPPPVRNTSPQATAPTMAMPITTERPVVAADKPAAAPAPATEPAGEPRRATAAAAPAKSSSGALSIIGIVLVVLIVGGIVAYVKLMGGTAAAKVTTVVATPREVVRLYDGAAEVKKSEGQTLSFGEAGKVSDVVAAGTEAKAGMPLATLDSYAKVEKDLADVKDRLGYYEKQLSLSKAKNDAEGIKADEAKVEEKKKLVAELEARASKVRLVAPGPGTVAQVMVQAGADAKAGDPVVRMADKRSLADFKIPAADAATLKAGAPVTVQPAAGGAPINARVAKVEGGTVTVELGDDAPVKPGDSLRLVKARVANVVPVPASAVVKRDGGDVVFVLADGAVHQRKVNVVDRSGAQVLVGGGLTSGDQVVSSGAENLKDGDKASQ